MGLGRNTVTLSGNFSETSFPRLLRIYAESKQTLALHVMLGSSIEPDGTFYIENGVLAGGSLSGVRGREALKRALRLREGRFRAEIGVMSPGEDDPALWKQLLLDELILLEKEGKGMAPPPTPHPGSVPLTTSPSHPVPSTRVNTSSTTAVPAPVRPPLPPRSGLAGGQSFLKNPTKVAGIAAAVAVILVVGLWLLMRSPSGRSASRPASGAATAKARTSGAARGITSDEILIGTIGPLSGPNKDRGRSARAGLEAAVLAVNEAGGVHGRKIRVLAVDDAYDPTRTSAALRELVEQNGVFAVVGSVAGATQAVPYCTENRVLLFGSVSGASILRTKPPSRYVFAYRGGADREAAAAVRYLADLRHIPPAKIAVLAEQDEFGETGWQGASKQLESYGLPSNKVLRLRHARNSLDFREALSQARAHTDGVEAVVLVSAYKSAATFVRKSKDAGLKLAYVAVSEDSSAFAAELVESGRRYTEDVTMTQFVPVPTSQATALMRYRKELERMTLDEKGNSTSLETWIVANIFIEALRRAGRDLSTDKVISVLEELRGWDMGIGANISFSSASHQGIDKVWGWQLQSDGSWRHIDLE